MDKIKIFIIAGEPSGDLLGGKLMSEIKSQSEELTGKKVEFIGLGGPRMAEQGLNSIFSIDELSVMGFVEVAPHIPKLLKRINQTAKAIIESGAQMVITIDSPDFCFRVIKKLGKISLPNSKIIKTHLIAPSVWAYRPGRAKKIAKIYDLLLAILPFEPPYFEKHGLETLFIGHPITENNHEISGDFRKQNNIADDQLLICAMAGSRIGEVTRIFPEIIGGINILAQKYPNLVVAMPVIAKTKPIIESHLHLLNAKVILIDEDKKYELFKAANLAIAKSGTNNLEIAIAKLPMITIYKLNPLTHSVLKRLIKIKFANLINLILNRELIPELLQDNCQAKKIAEIAEHLISNPQAAQNQVDEAQDVLKILGLGSSESPSQKAAKKILSFF
ncbi:MAG: lipid-A-disaccharide synthase [Rickettsiaceae bacterium]|jgi:lipid-A-disaccharide synthase|nr:lipid-A-disaccharide synthase [Rickettsiaceae bacterium]